MRPWLTIQDSLYQSDRILFWTDARLLRQSWSSRIVGKWWPLLRHCKTTEIYCLGAERNTSDIWKQVKAWAVIFVLPHDLHVHFSTKPQCNVCLLVQYADTVFRFYTAISHQPRYVESMLADWSTVCDAGPTLTQHWFNVTRFLGISLYNFMYYDAFL